jgi:hypothetical protein
LSKKNWVFSLKQVSVVNWPPKVGLFICLFVLFFVFCFFGLLLWLWWWRVLLWLLWSCFSC